jgi:hypothetical protein
VPRTVTVLGSMRSIKANGAFAQIARKSSAMSKPHQNKSENPARGRTGLSGTKRARGIASLQRLDAPVREWFKQQRPIAGSVPWLGCQKELASSISRFRRSILLAASTRERSGWKSFS